MSLTLSRREIGLLCTLLHNANEGLFDTWSADSASTDGGDGAFPKSARLNKLIASNLRQKLQSELTEKSQSSAESPRNFQRGSTVLCATGVSRVLGAVAAPMGRRLVL